MNFITKNDIKVGLTNGKLDPYQKTPNCVSTQATDERHRIEPISYNSTLDEALD